MTWIRSSLLAAVQRLTGRDDRLPPLDVSRVADHDAFQAYASTIQNEHARRAAREQELASAGEEFSIPGICYPCASKTSLRVDYRFADTTQQPVVPNWRERLECRRCGLNNRLRATIHILEQECRPQQHHRIYATEQRSKLFEVLLARYPHVTGSEFLDDSVPRGSIDSAGIRNENLTDLTFADASFDVLLCFEVLEHVPDFGAALQQVFRVLRPGGFFLFTVPFDPGSAETTRRARVEADGTITHLLEPEYHGDPLSASGILCFHNFGWDLLGHARRFGFADVHALFYWSELFGYLGIQQVMFLARKP